MELIEEFKKTKQEREIEQRLDTIFEKPSDRLRLNILKGLRNGN